LDDELDLLMVVPSGGHWERWLGILLGGVMVDVKEYQLDGVLDRE